MEKNQNQVFFGRKMDPYTYDETPAKKLGKENCIVIKAYGNKEVEQEHII